MDIKEEPGFLHFCSENERAVFSKDSVKKIKTEGVTSSSDCNIDTKTETEEPLASNIGLQDKKVAFSEDPIIEFNKSSKDSETETQIEIKEEQWWLEKKSAGDGIKDGTEETFSSTESSRLYKQNVSGYKPTLFSKEDLGKDTRFHIRKQRSRKNQGCEMDTKTNVKEEVIPEEGTSNEKTFSTSYPEGIFENNITTSQEYFEMDNRINIRELDISDADLQHEVDICPVNHEIYYGNDIKTGGNDFKAEHKINIKEEVTELSCAGHEINYPNDTASRRNVFEMDSKIIKEEVGILDKDLPNESACFSTEFGNGFKSEAVTCGTNFDLDKNTELKEDWAFNLDFGFQNQGKNFSSEPVNELKKQHIMSSDNGEAGIETSTEAECHSEVPLSNVLHQNKTRDNKPEDLEQPESSRLCTHMIWRDSSVSEGSEPFHIGKSVCSLRSMMFESDRNCNSLLYSKEQPLNIYTTPQHETASKIYTDKSSLKVKDVIHYDKTAHKCDVCHKCFTQLQTLKTHKLIHEGKKPYQCNVCKYRFTQISTLKTHSLIHEGKKPHECNVCKKRFSRLSHLKRHSLIHEGRKPQEREVYKKRFNQVISVKKHSLTCEDIKPHECNICKKRFTDRSNLKRHLFIHENKKPYECNVCKKRFTQLSSMRTHSLIHEGRKPYECNVCQKGFSDRSTWKRHTFIHGGKKPHECNVCNKRFTDRSYLKRHSLIHEGKMPNEGEKPHECNICKRRFTDRSSLKRHTFIHEGKKPHECNVCKKRFTRLSHLRVHHWIHEDKKPHECDICKKRFAYPSTLKRHNLVHGSKKSNTFEGTAL